MVFKNETDSVDVGLLQLAWKWKGNRLILEGMPQDKAQELIKRPGVLERIKLLVRQAGAEMAQIIPPGQKNGFRIFAAALEHTSEKTMTNQVPLSNTRPPDEFVWFGGMITPDLQPHIEGIIARMRESDKPTGVVQPTINNDGVIKTIQWGINKASVSLFNFDALSLEDMKAAIQRDTSGDWFPDDLEEKRRLYEQAGSNFEQVARIRTKSGWMLVRFQTQRLDVGNLFISQGQQESEVVQRPDLLLAV
jgi:hypothetical protein